MIPKVQLELKVLCMLVTDRALHHLYNSIIYLAGPGACDACAMAVIDGDSGNITQCMPEESECEDGYHQHIRTKEEGGPMVGKLVS